MKLKDDVKVNLRYGRKNKAIIYGGDNQHIIYIDNDEFIRELPIEEAYDKEIEGVMCGKILFGQINIFYHLSYGFKTVSYENKHGEVSKFTIDHRFMRDNGIYVDIRKFVDKSLQEWYDTIRDNAFKYLNIAYPQGYYIDLNDEEMTDFENRIFRKKYASVDLFSKPLKDNIGRPVVYIGKDPEVLSDVFDYVEVTIPFVENMKNREEYIKIHFDELMQIVRKKVCNNREYKRYKIPFNYLKLTRITITHDSQILLYFNLKTI